MYNYLSIDDIRKNHNDLYDKTLDKGLSLLVNLGTLYLFNQLMKIQIINFKENPDSVY